MDEENRQTSGGYGTDGYWTAAGQDSVGWKPVDQRQQLKEARRHFSRIGCMFLVGTFAIFASQLATTYLAAWLRPEWLQNGNVALILSMAPLYLVGMPVLILLVRRIPGRSPERRPIKAGQFIASVVMCFGLVYMTNILGNIITAIIGMLKGGSVQNQLMNVTESVSLWMIALYMVICAPIMEEYIFRKLIVDRTLRYGQGVSVLVSGLMFGLFHGNLNQFVYAFVLGLFLAFLYVKTGNLKVTIAIHMMINFMGGLVSSALMRAIDLNRYLELATEMDMAALMEFVNDNMAGLLAYGVFMIFIFGTMIATLVLFIICLVKRKFRCAKGEVEIPGGKRFRTVFLNAGMIFYGIFWTAMIIYQLLA